ncbi:MAG: zinc ribbon domain-containing protein, partial [Candidatus Aminicenantaceae bacterium]
PYCKAIIDQGSEYCSNCGTQLLFPEDEFIEEEIPGDKIVEEEEEEEEAQSEEEKVEEKEGAPQSEKIKFDTEDLEHLPDARTKEQEEMGKILKDFKGEGVEGAPVYREDVTPPIEGEGETSKPIEIETPEEQPEEKEDMEEPPSPTPSFFTASIIDEISFLASTRE